VGGTEGGLTRNTQEKGKDKTKKKQKRTKKKGKKEDGDKKIIHNTIRIKRKVKV